MHFHAWGCEILFSTRTTTTCPASWLCGIVMDGGFPLANVHLTFGWFVSGNRLVKNHQSESLSKCIPQSRKIRPEDYFECSIQSKGFKGGGVRGVKKVELKDSCFKGQTGRIGSIGSLSSSQSSVCPAEDSAHKAAKVMLLYSEKSLWIKHLECFHFTVLSLVRMQFQCTRWRSTGVFLNGKTEWAFALFQSENVVF